MKNHLYFLTILLSGFCSLQSAAQSNVANNCDMLYDAQDLNINLTSGPFADLSQSAGVPCNSNTFFSLTASGTIEELVVNGSTITSNGSIAQATGYYSLAYCNNLNGGAFSPTFYSHLGSTYGFDYYNGTSWTLTGSPPVDFPGGIAGFGNSLYLSFTDSIVLYDGTTFSKIYDPGNQVITIGDAAVDNLGNIWCMIGNVFPNTNTIVAISPSGQIVKQYGFALNTINAYGCFMLNSVLYVGFGNLNPTYPDKILPISFTSTTAIPGTPISFSSASYVRDFASCDPGSPISVSEYESENQIPVFPNPAGNFLYLNEHFSNAGTCSIYKPDGALVADDILVDEKGGIKVEQLPTGIYFLEVRKGDSIYRAQFIKQ